MYDTDYYGLNIPFDQVGSLNNTLSTGINLRRQILKSIDVRI